MSISNLLTPNDKDWLKINNKIEPKDILLCGVQGSVEQIISTNANNELEWLDTKVGENPLEYEVDAEQSGGSNAYIIYNTFNWTTPVLDAGTYIIEYSAEMKSTIGGAQIGLRAQVLTTPQIPQNILCEENVIGSSDSSTYHSVSGFTIITLTSDSYDFRTEGRVQGGNNCLIRKVRYRMFKIINP